MGIEFVGADASDPGPRGVIARFVLATAEKDADAGDLAAGDPGADTTGSGDAVVEEEE